MSLILRIVSGVQRKTVCSTRLNLLERKGQAKWYVVVCLVVLSSCRIGGQRRPRLSEFPYRGLFDVRCHLQVLRWDTTTSTRNNLVEQCSRQ
jgi:hypothetical protein